MLSCYRTWNKKPHGNSAVSVGVGGHAVVLPGILSPHPTDLQGRVGQHLYPPCAGPDDTTCSVPGQVVAHGAFHLAGQRGHGSHRGSHIECWLQDWRRFWLTKTSNWRYQQLNTNVCAGMLSVMF